MHDQPSTTRLKHDDVVHTACSLWQYLGLNVVLDDLEADATGEVVGACMRAPG